MNKVFGTGLLSLKGYCEIDEVIKYLQKTNPKILQRDDIYKIVDVETRCNIYDIKKYINLETTLLDIGCCTGLFSIYLSLYIKKCIGIDYDNNNIEIANKHLDKSELNNCNFIYNDFGTFYTNNIIKYDFILCLAVEKWIRYYNKLTPQELTTKLINLLNIDGYILIESHILSTNEYINEWDIVLYNLNKYCNQIYKKKSRENRDILLFQLNN